MQIAGCLIPVFLAFALAGCGGGNETTGAADAKAPADAASAATEATAPAPDAATTAASDLDPASFELDMGRVDRWLDATRRLSELTEADESLEEVVSADANEPREDFIAALEAHPAVAAAIRDAGMSPGEYALTTETLIGALFAVGMLEASATKELPEALRDAQPVAFVQANKAEITAKMEALKRGDSAE